MFGGAVPVRVGAGLCARPEVGAVPRSASDTGGSGSAVTN